MDVPAKPYDNVEQAKLGDEHLKFFILNMQFPAFLYFTSGKSHRSYGNIRHIIDSSTPDLDPAFPLWLFPFLPEYNVI